MRKNFNQKQINLNLHIPSKQFVYDSYTKRVRNSNNSYTIAQASTYEFSMQKYTPIRTEIFRSAVMALKIETITFEK